MEFRRDERKKGGVKMSTTYVFPEVPTHTGNGLDVEKTHKSCKRIVKNLQESKMDDAHRVYVRSMDKATTNPVKGEVDGECGAKMFVLFLPVCCCRGEVGMGGGG